MMLNDLDYVDFLRMTKQVKWLLLTLASSLLYNTLLLETLALQSLCKCCHMRPHASSVDQCAAKHSLSTKQKRVRAAGLKTGRCRAALMCQCPEVYYLSLIIALRYTSQ